MKTRILIDSRAREGGDVRDFWLELRPTIERVRRVSLVWMDIPNPLQSPGGPYFLIRIPELGTRTRVVGRSASSSGLETTFIVPITVNVDERCFYSPETAFSQEMNYTPPISIQRLSVSISRNYDATPLTGESVLILELEHD